MILCFVFVLSMNAQNEDNTVLLKKIVEKIAEDHKVEFNYIEDELAIFKIIPPKSNLTLNQKLDYISDKTHLKFQFISKTYISIINNKKLDKPLCGYVKDIISNQPIEYANIKITGTNFGTSSNENGYFELDVKSVKEIEITHLNYEKITIQPIDLYTEGCPTLTLKPITTELSEVVTQTYLTKGITKKIDGTFEIRPKKFGLLPGLTEPDVYETLKQIPGIASTDETISNLNVRGGTHDQNLFLWNGIRLFQTGHFFGLISALNPNLAHTIKITKNGSSPFYGESVSSVIDISTHSKNLEETSGSIGMNMISADVYAKIKTSKTSNLELSARRSHTDFINSPTYRSYYNRIFQNTAVTNLTNDQIINYTNDEKFYFYDFTLQFQQKINSKIDFTLDLISITNLLEFDETKLENENLISKNSCLEQQTRGGNAALKINWNKKNQTDVSFYGSYYSIDSENQSIENNQIFNQENTILDTGFRLKNSHQITKNWKFNNGYQFNEIGIRNFDRVNSPVFSRKIKDVLMMHAVIAEFMYSSENNKLKTNFGIRQNYITQLQEFLFEPRLQFNYSISNSFFVEILAERKSQVTSQIVDLQQDFLGVEKRRWILANNETIPVIKSNQISLGFTFKKNNWLLTIDNFYKSVNGITSMSQGFQNQLEFSKIDGEYTVIGSEILVQKQFEKFTTWISYTYNKNDYNFESFATNAFPNNFEINHNIGMAVIYDYRKLKIALGSRWFTGKPNTLPSSILPIFNTPGNPEIGYQAPNSSNLEDYFQANFSSSYGISMSKKSELVFGFSIQNLLDSKIIINQNYRVNTNTNSIEQVNTNSLERTLNAFLRYNF
jgi:CarboxypepD_reg-like domain/TonB-dependent Receptor Plug Domain